MHLAIISQLNYHLCPALQRFKNGLEKKSEDFFVSTLCQTHLSNAVPKIFGQDFTEYIRQISSHIQLLITYQNRLYQLSIDNTAAGIEINSPKTFVNVFVKSLQAVTGFPFTAVSDGFEELHTYSIMMELSGALNTLAVSLSQ
jgi:fumarate hydratase class II